MDKPLFVHTGEAMQQLGATLAGHLVPGMTVFLQGDLGAGKTTLVQGILRALGITGPIKSPTYTLVEPYTYERGHIYHFDLYRLGHPEELEYVGIRDYCSDDSISLIEWPEKAAAYLPSADLTCYIKHFDQGRALHFDAGSQTGKKVLAKVRAQLG